MGGGGEAGQHEAGVKAKVLSGLKHRSEAPLSVSLSAGCWSHASKTLMPPGYSRSAVCAMRLRIPMQTKGSLTADVCACVRRRLRALEALLAGSQLTSADRLQEWSSNVR